MNLLRNEKVIYQGRRMIVIEHDIATDRVELAAPGWDGKTAGTKVPASEVIPLEQMLGDEARAFIKALSPEQKDSALHYLTGWAPHAFVQLGRTFTPELLPERLRGDTDGGAL